MSVDLGFRMHAERTPNPDSIKWVLGEALLPPGQSAHFSERVGPEISPLAAGLFHRAIVQSGGYSPTSMAAASNHVTDGGETFSAPEIVNHLLVSDGTVTDLEAVAEVLTQPVVFDGRNVFKPDTMANAGFEYHSVGRADVRIGQPVASTTQGAAV